ncbi:uncharacterized protein [Rutidosis leptorrhynchoides]|uniref:uncharacterized protein n=1 Tax=Rutidosis leptorrhynchoides TaxID=125765 RepID=UPI003A99017F
MEDYNDGDQATGSPTAGESGFVHVESINSPSVNSSSSSNQDDGVVVARVDSVDVEPSELKLTDDGGNEEFVDCPDDLVSYDGRTMDEIREDELVLEGQTTFGNDAGLSSHRYQEERQQLMTELTSLRYQLKSLVKKHELVGVSNGGSFTDDITSTLPLHVMINHCSRFIELALNEQSQTEGSIRDLYDSMDMKERTIEDLNTKVVELSSVEMVADRISSLVTTVLGEEEFVETSVSGKLSHIEKNMLVIIQKYNRLLNQGEMLNQCLTQVKSDYHSQVDMEKVLVVAREELILLKRKEFELVHKGRYLENEYGKLMQHLEKSKETIETLNSDIGKLKDEVEVHKTRFNSTKEKLNLAVTKGKSLVQHRDSLKQMIVEKTSELDKCLIELQEKSSELNAVKQESIKLQDECNATKEAARAEVDRATIALLVEAQEKCYLEDEFANLKDKNGSLQVVIQRYEDKVVLLREKLSMAVKKGKGLVQERAEKNAQIEALKLELMQKEATMNDYRDQISKCEGLVQEQEATINDYRDQICKCEGLVQEQEVTINDYRDQISKCEGLVQEQEAMINAYRDQISKCEGLVQEQEATINDYRDQISKCEGLVQEQEATIHDCRDQISKCEGLVQEQEATMNDYRDQISKFEGLVQECAEKNAQIEALKLETIQQEATVNDYRDQIIKFESLVQECAEMKAQIEGLKIELKQKEATVDDYRDQISKYSIEVGQIEKLESELLSSKEERDQIEQFLVQSNSVLQRVVESTDSTVLPVGLTDPVEKVKWFVAYTNECQIAKAKLEQELGMLNNKLTDTLATVKSLEDALSVSEKQVNLLTEENKQLKVIKTDTEEKLQTHVSQFTNVNKKAVDDRNILEDEMKKFKEEAEYNERKFMDASATVKTLEDALLKAENTISDLVGRNNTTKQEISTLNVDLSACRQELADKHDRVATLEHDIRVLRSACADVSKELKITVEDNIKEIDSSHYSVYSNVGAVDDLVVADIKVVEEMLSTARIVRSVIKHFVDLKQKMSTTIKELQAELEERRSLYDKGKEENDMLRSRVNKLENDIETSQNLHDEMSTKLEEYRAKEDEWNKKEAELFKQSNTCVKDPEAENDLLSASEVNSIFSKINGITIPFPNIGAGDIDVHNSDPVKKLFYIIDNLNELLDHINSLSHSKEELQSTLSTQALEIENFKEELEDFENMKKEIYKLSIGFEHIIREFGGDVSDVGNKSADVAGMLSVLESLIRNIYLDSEREKAKSRELGVNLSDTEKAAEELANKVKLLEDFNQNRTGLPDSIHGRGSSESSSLPPRPEISEVDDPGPVGKRATPLVRTLRKGSNDHLALNIDPESEYLIDKPETLEDKGHIFKSLHTSGLVPVQGKIIADRLDGLWVSGGRGLMSRPRARLGLIAYWVVLHLWLLGTLL